MKLGVSVEMTTPFDLANGVRLECAGLVLPWDSSIEKLCAIGKPEIYRHPSATNVTWKGEAIFGGVPVHLDAMTASGPNVFYARRVAPAESAQSEYASLLHILTAQLGSPHSTIVEDGYPWSRWIWGDIGVGVRIAERFVEYVPLMITKGILRV